jgi:hypothetical protein
MNRTLKARYLNQKPQPNKGGAESARQAIARDATSLFEIHTGMPALLTHLAELQELDAKEDEEKEANTAKTDEVEESDTVSDLDEAPIDLTDEAEPEPEPKPTPIKAKMRKGAFDDLVPRQEARELVPV